LRPKDACDGFVKLKRTDYKKGAASLRTPPPFSSLIERSEGHTDRNEVVTTKNIVDTRISIGLLLVVADDRRHLVEQVVHTHGEREVLVDFETEGEVEHVVSTDFFDDVVGRIIIVGD